MSPIDLELDRELSALADGEVAPERAAELRALADSDPAIAERIAHFEALRAALAEAPAAALPGDLRSRLAARIDAGEADAIDLDDDPGFAPLAASPTAAPEPAPVVSLGERRSRQLQAGVAIAAAAALALYFVVTSGGSRIPQVPADGGVEIAETAPEPAPVAPTPLPEPATTPEPEKGQVEQLADLPPEVPEIEVEPDEVIERFEPLPKRFDPPELIAALPSMPGQAAPDPEPEVPEELEEADLELAALALHIDELQDFEAIEQLELLEWMVAAEG